MSIGNVKPDFFALDHGDTTETIPYVEGFEYDEDESIVFSATAWMSATALFVEMTGCGIAFDLDDLLANALARIKADDETVGKQEDIDNLLSLFKKYIKALEA